MLYKSGYLLCLTLLIASCVDNPTRVPDTEIQSADERHKTKAEKIDLEKLKLLSPDQAIATLGKTNYTEDFDLSTSLNEFRIEIYNYIPEKDRSSAKIKIRELSWVYNNEKNITLWYQYKQDKWQYLHYSIWYKDAQF